MRHSQPVRYLNRTYRVGLNAVRLETAPTGPDKSGSKPRGESVYLFLDCTIILAYAPIQRQVKINNYFNIELCVPLRNVLDRHRLYRVRRHKTKDLRVKIEFRFK